MCTRRLRTTRRNALRLAMLLLLSTACGPVRPAGDSAEVGPGSTGTPRTTEATGTTAPGAPALCAGPDRVPPDGRASRWRSTVTALATGGAGAEPELWFSLARKASIEEALALSNGLTLTGEAFVLPSNGGAVLKGTQSARDKGERDPTTANPSPAALRDLLRRHLASVVDSARPVNDPGVVEARRLVEAGDIPIGAIRVRGTRAALEALLSDHPCDVYAIDIAGRQPPLLSRAVDPT